MKKNILMLLTNGFDPDVRVYKEAKSLIKGGYNITILCWDREKKYPQKETIDQINIKRIQIRAKYTSICSLFFKLPLFWIVCIYKSIFLNFDIIHCHDFDALVPGYFIKIIKRKKLIYDSHDLYFEYFLVYKQSKFRKLTSQIFEKLDIFLAKRTDQVITVTENIGGKLDGLKEYYQNRGVKNIITVWNVTDLDHSINYTKINLKKSAKFTIGYIGRIRTINKFILLFNAIKELGVNDYKILFVGKGPMLDKLKQIVKKQYKNIEIQFLNQVSYNQVVNYFKICDCVYSVHGETRNENLKRAIQTKVFEAAVLDIPIIVQKGTLNEDFVNKYNIGYVIDDKRIDDLVKGIKYIQNNYQQLKKNCKQVKQDWNWENEEKKIIKLYKTILK